MQPKIHSDLKRALIGPLQAFAQWRGIRLFAFIVAIVCAVLWASERDPFKRFEIKVDTPHGELLGRAITPRSNKTYPVVIFLRAIANKNSGSGPELRLLAEQNLAAVTFEYGLRNESSLETEIVLIRDYLLKQSWARKDSFVWIEELGGAGEVLELVLKRNDLQPTIIAILSNDLFRDNNSVWAKANVEPVLTSTGNHQRASKFLIVHEKSDETLAELATSLTRADFGVTVFSYYGKFTSLDRAAAIRVIGEFCASYFGVFGPLPVNVRPACLEWWLPAGLLVLPILWSLRPRRLVGFQPPLGIVYKILRVTATVLALLTLSRIVIVYAHPWLLPTGIQEYFVRNWLLRRDQLEDLDYLTAQFQSSGVVLSESLPSYFDLLSYNRKLVAWHYSTAAYQNYVIFPVVEGDPNRIFARRRLMWEACLPLVRREREPVVAACKIVGFLRGRVSVVPRVIGSGAIAPNVWDLGVANTNEFESLYLSALRSVGIASRLNSTGQVELLVGHEWHLAPRPPFDTFLRGQ